MSPHGQLIWEQLSGRTAGFPAIPTLYHRHDRSVGQEHSSRGTTPKQSSGQLVIFPHASHWQTQHVTHRYFLFSSCTAALQHRSLLAAFLPPPGKANFLTTAPGQCRSCMETMPWPPEVFTGSTFLATRPFFHRSSSHKPSLFFFQNNLLKCKR